MNYDSFLKGKAQLSGEFGFEPVWMPDFLFDFQQSLVEWAVRKGRAALFCDCGLGKTPMQLVWSENIVRKTNKRILILTPLAVSDQTIAEGEKFGIECKRSKSGKLDSKIIITNYESLHHFNPADFVGVVADESAILKNFDGVRRKEITEFMRVLPYRLLCTATAAPNDYIELGTSSEALGELGYMDMLTRFFKSDNTVQFKRNLYGDGTKWRFKKHAEKPFWQWVCSWARACRKPSDLGFDDDRFILPPLHEQQTVVKSAKPMDGYLFELPAIGLQEQRDELRHTIRERCESAASKAQGKGPAVLWCHLNQEGDLLESLVSDSKQVTGSQSDDEKEEIYRAFKRGQIRVLVTKPKLGAWGLNWEHCSRTTFFPSHSFEQYYQAVRRFWRFGQQRQVDVSLITTEGQRDVLTNLKRKASAADRMFSELVKYMRDALAVDSKREFPLPLEAPSWL